VTPDLRWVYHRTALARLAQRRGECLVPGYVSNEDFLRALSQAGVVVAMTKNENRCTSGV